MNNFLYYSLVAFASLILFLYGFFPMQQTQTVDAIQPPTFLNDIEFNVSRLYKQEINRLVLVVIDALRFDFITEESMPFLVSIYPSEGCLLTMQVESPTVTLPRIKALTTGGIPQFSDIIFNLASTEILKDSLLHKAKASGKKIVFYGDDTWIKLYPNIFERCEGVTSFYVNDFTEVDNNVTLNVAKELNSKDWDIMVLHYLGLDHIGHVFGPYSHLVKPKLREMDSIIEQIYQTSKTWDSKTLIAITGDHGMKDSGGHGGSTVSETLVPFIPIGIPCKNGFVAQTDVPATLASVLGLSHPASSIGSVISSMFITFPLDQLLYILRYNVLSLQSKMIWCENIFDEASILHYNFINSHNESDAIRAQKLYEQCSREISDKLVHSSVKQDIHILLVSSALLIHSLCAIVYEFIRPAVIKKRTEKFEQILIVLILALQVIPKSSFLTSSSLFIISIFVLRYIILIVKSMKWKLKCDINSYIIFGTVMHSLTLTSSSFIEEEHQVWYFIWSSFTLLSWYFMLHELQALQWLILVLGLRLLKTINQTGDKWAHLPDLSQWLLLEDNYIYLEVLFGISLVLILLCCLSLQGKHKSTLISSGIALFLIYIFHAYKMENSFLVKLIWFFIFLNLCLGLMLGNQNIEHIIVMWALYCTTLIRSYNVILLPACIYASTVLCKYIQSVEALTISHIWLGRTLFFCQGHSNSLASIDIASGYVGLEEYIPFFVIMQVLCHTYAFPILASLLSLRNCILHTDTVYKVNIICRLLVLTITCIIILIQRHHLFVWTVFAPKLLVESCHTAVLFTEIIVFYCVVNVHKAFVISLKNR